MAGGFAFDPSDSRIAFGVATARGFYVVVDGHPFGPTQEKPFFQFSSDGDRVVYADLKKQFVYVIDRRYQAQHYKFSASDSSGKNQWPSTSSPLRTSE